MLHGPEEIAGQDMGLRDRSGAPEVGLVQAFGFDPVPNPVGHVVDDSDIIDMANGRMVELA